MARLSSLFLNLGRRKNPKSQSATLDIRSRNPSSDQFSVKSEDVSRNHRNPITVQDIDRIFGNIGANTISKIREKPPSLGVKSEDVSHNHRNPITVHDIDRIFGNIGANTISEIREKPPSLGVKFAENQVMCASKIAKEVCNVMQTQPKWEKTLLSDFPKASFTDPNLYNEILKHQRDLSLSLRFYLWLRSLDGFSFDPVLCNEMFGRLVEAKDVAKTSLDDREFEVEPWFLELYARCLCENELIDQVLDVLERFKMIGHSLSLETWNWVLSHSLRMGRVDVVWKLHEDMVKCGVVTDVSTMGYLIQAFCLENNVSKGYQLLDQVLKTGHLPDKIVFNNLISALGKNGKYGKVSAVLRKMIANNCYPDIHTYNEIIRFCRGGMTCEGVRIITELKNRGYVPDRVMYTTMINNLCENKDIQGARKLWFEMIKGGIFPNEYTYSVFVGGLFRNGCINEAEKLHREMLSKGFPETTLSFNTRIYGLCINKKMKAARLLFEEMNAKGIVKDSITYDSMIQGYSKQNNKVEALYFLHELLKQGFEPSSTTLDSVITVLCNSGLVNEAERMWLEMQETGFKPVDDSLSSIIFGLSKQGQFAEMNEWLNHMMKNRVKPKMITFEKLINCLCEAYRLDDALVVLRYMVKMGYLLKGGVCNALVSTLCQANPDYVKALLWNILEGTEYQKHWSPILPLVNESVPQPDWLIPCSQEETSPLLSPLDQSISQTAGDIDKQSLLDADGHTPCL